LPLQKHGFFGVAEGAKFAQTVALKRLNKDRARRHMTARKSREAGKKNAGNPIRKKW